jgi:glutamyl/glutaminyl-tRNA synthetase
MDESDSATTSGGDTLNPDKIKEAINQTGKEASVKGKQLFMGLRLAATGRLEGLELPIYLALLGKRRVTERLTKMISLKEALAEATTPGATTLGQPGAVR